MCFAVIWFGDEAGDILLAAKIMNGVKQQNFYLTHQSKYQKEFNRLQKAALQVLKDKFDESTVQTMLHEMQAEYTDLLPRIPFIGGDKNILTKNLTVCAQYLPICKILQKYHMSIPQISDAIRTICETQLNSMPWLQKVMMRILWKLMFTKWFKLQMQKTAIESQQKEFKDNFIYEFVDGDGKRFNFGYNFTECAICNFFRQENAFEFAPLMCELDYVLADFVNVKLVRTETLAKGAKCCDFRYLNCH